MENKDIRNNGKRKEKSEIKKKIGKSKSAHLEAEAKAEDKMFKLQMYVPAPLMDKIKRIAMAERRIKSAQILEFLEEGVERYESKNKKEKD